MAAVISLCAFSPSVYAEAEVTEIEVPVYHSFVETETEVSDLAQVIQKGAYLASGTVRLVDKGNGKVAIYGDTTAYSKCDKLYLDIYLEQSTNGTSFYSYDSWSYTASNTASLAKEFTKSVPKGYYYRLQGYHAAKKGSVMESTSTRTGGMYIG